MLVSTTALAGARGTSHPFHGPIYDPIDPTFVLHGGSSAHTSDQETQPHLGSHHNLEKLGLLVDRKRLNAFRELANFCCSARHC